MPSRKARLLFTGSFHADQHERALDALETRIDGGARDILYIVASAAARRRAIADLLARRGAVFGLTVKTIRSLPAELFRRAHRSAPAIVDPTVADLLTERELRTATGNRFGDVTPIQGLAATAASTIDALERNGAAPADLAAAIEGKAVSDGARAFTRAWHTLSVRRARLGSSDTEALVAASDLLREDDSVLRGLDAIVIEDLAANTKVERDLIAALVGSAPCDVIAAHGFVRQIAGASSSRSIDWLRSTCEWEETQCDPRTPVFDSLFADSARVILSCQAKAVIPSAARNPQAPDRGPSIGTMRIPRFARDDKPLIPTTLLEAAGDVGEVRLAARVVRRHLDSGVPARDIAIVVHGAASRYRELIREVFEGAGIAVDATLRRTVADSAIGTVLLQLLGLAILSDRMTRETSLAVARSAHIDLAPGARDRLHRHIITAGYLGLDGWDKLSVELLGEHATNRINRLKRAVAEARAGFGAVSSPAGAASVVRRLAKELRLVHNATASRLSFRAERRRRGVEESQLSRQRDPSTGATAIPRLRPFGPSLGMTTARNDKVIREDNMAWEAIVDALDKVVPTMLEIDRSATGKTGLEYAKAWLAMFSRGLRETAVGAERAPAGAVQVRSTGPGCEAPARVTIVLGLIEKIFPRQARQDPFLDDDLRLSLRERFGWELPISTDTVDRERECFIRAISSATEALYLSHPATDADGRPTVRSFFIDDYEALVGSKLPVERASTPSAIAPLRDSATTPELMTAIAHDVWQYLPRTADSDERRAAAFRALEALARQDANSAAVRHGRRVSQLPRLDGVLPEQAPHLTLTLSASQLKSIGHCTYEHFVDKVLSPIVLRPPEYDSLEKGKLIHAAVMHWSTELNGWTRGEAALADLRTWYHAQIAAWSPAQRGTERTARATEADLERLEELLRTELGLLCASGVAQPEYAELAFGEKMIERGPRHPESRTDAFVMQVETDLGPRDVSFHGSLDRVDVAVIGGKRYGVVLDYKTGKTSKYYAKEMMDGDDLQLRLYLLVLERFWGIIPVGALYLGFGDGVRRGALRADLRSKFAGIDEDAVELLPHDEWAAFVDETPRLIAKLVHRLVTLDVRPAPRKNDCGFCELQPLCRYDRWT
jgi:RecB family exonuclease